MSETTYHKLWKVPPKLKPTTARLSTYSGQRLVVLGTLSLEVKYEAQQIVLVVQGSGPTLLGRDWLKHIQEGVVHSLQSKVTLSRGSSSKARVLVPTRARIS